MVPSGSVVDLSTLKCPVDILRVTQTQPDDFVVLETRKEIATNGLQEWTDAYLSDEKAEGDGTVILRLLIVDRTRLLDHDHVHPFLRKGLVQPNPTPTTPNTNKEIDIVSYALQKHVSIFTTYHSAGDFIPARLNHYPADVDHGLKLDSFPNIPDAQTYRLITSGHLLVWTYFPSSNQTVALYVTDGWAKAVREFVDVIKENKTLCQQSMFFGYVTALGRMGRFVYELDHIVMGFREVLGKTGYHDVNFPIASMESVPEGDWTGLSATVAGLMQQSDDVRFSSQALQELANFMVENNTFPASDRVLQPAGYDAASAALIWQVKNIARDCHGFHRRAQFWRETGTTQIQVLFNLITRNDQLLMTTLAEDSRYLARESKRDSTSMKAIAAVTMCFLPATFVASMFSMPIFDWDADNNRGEDVVNRRFWVYWAVTVPLTVLTVVVWLIYNWYAGKKMLPPAVKPAPLDVVRRRRRRGHSGSPSSSLRSKAVGSLASDHNAGPRNPSIISGNPQALNHPNHSTGSGLTGRPGSPKSPQVTSNPRNSSSSGSIVHPVAHQSPPSISHHRLSTSSSLSRRLASQHLDTHSVGSRHSPFS